MHAYCVARPEIKKKKDLRNMWVGGEIEVNSSQNNYPKFNKETIKAKVENCLPHVIFSPIKLLPPASRLIQF